MQILDEKRLDVRASNRFLGHIHLELVVGHVSFLAVQLVVKGINISNSYDYHYYLSFYRYRIELDSDIDIQHHLPRCPS